MSRQDDGKVASEQSIRLCKFSIDNFKSLVGFEMALTKFTCLVGLNGAGKSTVLQALDFLCQQMKGDLSGWLKNREWEAIDLKSKLSKVSNISFEVVFELGGKEVRWKGSFNRSLLRCTQETLEIADTTFMKVDDGRYSIIEHIQSQSKTLALGDINFDYQGSMLSLLKSQCSMTTCARSSVSFPA
ncbi:AAA family ATPase [Pseudomonas abieticivorans]|uniref:AAA family ATPase n=1 Tax=Pseudomonas abieticivorans TaxID=2931382 RepID=UPI0020BF81F6|nr:AAA family ATPase [Pseudomonas sp. PIA16]